jgi:hypothetical protein
VSGRNVGATVSAVGCAALLLVGSASSAWANDGEGGASSTTASASADGGTVTVQAGSITWTPPGGSLWAKRASVDPPPGPPNPNQPYGCRYQLLGPQGQQLLGAGGPQPGQWVIPICAGPGTIDPMPPFWVSQATGAVPPVSPATVAQQAVSELALPTGAIGMAPPTSRDQLVHVASWLWIDRATWRPATATATAGPVTATATAMPVKVVWNMGDGDQVTCNGPGTPYDSSQPNATTDCSYTWRASSAGQPGGVFEVTATVYWQVTWTAAGAPGGGNLGAVAGPPARAAVRVAESQGINNQASGS